MHTYRILERDGRDMIEGLQLSVKGCSWPIRVEDTYKDERVRHASVITHLWRVRPAVGICSSIASTRTSLTHGAHAHEPENAWDGLQQHGVDLLEAD